MDLNTAIDDLRGISPVADSLIKRVRDIMVEAAGTDDRSTDYEEIINTLQNGMKLDLNASRTIDLLSVMVLDLHSQVEALEAENLSMIEKYESKDVEASEDLEESIQEFRKSLEGATMGKLYRVYNEKLLKSLQPETRLVISIALVEYAADGLNKTPLSLWSKLANNDGKF